MRKRKRQAVKKLIQCAAVIAAGVLAIILFMLAIWYRGKNSEPVTDEQVAAQMQQAEPLVIETPEAATEGSIRVYDYDGWQEMNRHGQRYNRKRVKRHEKGLYMQPIQGERRRRAGQKHRLCAAADTAGVRGGLSTHYAAFIYDAVHGR